MKELFACRVADKCGPSVPPGSIAVLDSRQVLEDYWADGPVATILVENARAITNWASGPTVALLAKNAPTVSGYPYICSRTAGDKLVYDAARRALGMTEIIDWPSKYEPRRAVDLNVPWLNDYQKGVIREIAAKKALHMCQGPEFFEVNEDSVNWVINQYMLVWYNHNDDIVLTVIGTTGVVSEIVNTGRCR